MVKNISAEELREFIKTKLEDIEIIDVRQPEEYEKSHIEGAKLIPLDKLSNQINEINWDKKVIFVCRSGVRSEAAANIADSLNKNAFHLEGGILDFQKVYPEKICVK